MWDGLLCRVGYSSDLDLVEFSGLLGYQGSGVWWGVEESFRSTAVAGRRAWGTDGVDRGAGCGFREHGKEVAEIPLEFAQ